MPSLKRYQTNVQVKPYKGSFDFNPEFTLLEHAKTLEPSQREHNPAAQKYNKRPTIFGDYKLMDGQELVA